MNDPIFIIVMYVVGLLMFATAPEHWHRAVRQAIKTSCTWLLRQTRRLRR